MLPNKSIRCLYSAVLAFSLLFEFYAPALTVRAAEPEQDPDSPPLSIPLAPTQPLACTDPIRIMPLGDSITKGSASGALPDEAARYISYRRDLWNALLVAGYAAPDDNSLIDFVGSQVYGSYYQTTEGFDPDNEGWGGWTDADIAFNLYDNGGFNWLASNPADIILLHIGTNELDENPADVEDILDEVDQYEAANHVQVWVILARIINRSCSANNPACPEAATTTNFNNNVQSMAQTRIANGDKIILVDMENGAGIDYHLQSTGGNMWDDKHPYASGYSKIEKVWEQALLEQLLPLARYDSLTVSEDSSDKTVPVLGNDCGISPTITGVSQGNHSGIVSIAADKKTLNYRPAKDFYGVETFTYTINNTPPEADNGTQAVVTVTVDPVNDPPVAVPDSKSTLEDKALAIPASDLVANDQRGASNESGQNLSVTSVGPLADTHGSVALSGGTITYTPAKDYNGPASFQYTVCDDGSPTPECDSNGYVGLAVTPVNDAPTFTVSDLHVDEDSGPQETTGWAAGISSGPADEAGQALTFTLTGNSNPGLFAAQPAIDANTHILTYTPAANANGEAVLTVILSDNGGTANGGKDASSQTFHIVVAAVNDPPVVTQPLDYLFKAGESVSFQVVASDVEGTNLSYQAAGLPTGLSINSTTGLIQGKLPAGNPGSYQVQVTVRDANNGSTSVSFRIKVYNNLLFVPFMSKP